jgi:hypothetical protein
LTDTRKSVRILVITERAESNARFFFPNRYTKKDSEGSMASRLQLNCEELCEAYAAGLTVKALAYIHQCNPATMSRHLRRCGVVMRNGRFKTANVPEDELRRLYLTERLTISRIAAHFAVSTSTIGNKRRLYNITRRSKREGV